MNAKARPEKSSPHPPVVIDFAEATARLRARRTVNDRHGIARIAPKRIGATAVRALLLEFPQQWSAAAVAAALTLPADMRSNRAEWMELLDRLDDAIDAMIWRKARRRLQP